VLLHTSITRHKPATFSHVFSHTAKHSRSNLVRSPQPGILPANGYILVISSINNVGASVVADFERLVLAHGD
jgi:hypothetical protein